MTRNIYFMTNSDEDSPRSEEERLAAAGWPRSMLYPCTRTRVERNSQIDGCDNSIPHPAQRG